MFAITCSENVYARPSVYGRTRTGDLNATVGPNTKNSHLRNAVDDCCPPEPQFQGQGAKMSNGLLLQNRK